MSKSLTVAEDERIQASPEEIILHSSGNALFGKIRLINKGIDKLVFNEISLKSKKTGQIGVPDQISKRFSLRPGSERDIQVKIPIDPYTQPGTYERVIEIGGVSRKIWFVVRPFQKLVIQPNKIYLQDAAPGKVYSNVFRISNSGNIPVKIHGVKHFLMLDDNYLCKALTAAFSQKENQGFIFKLDAVVNKISTSLARQIEISIKESGQTILPGTSKDIHISLTLPKYDEPEFNYSGSFAVAGNKNIYYFINS